MRFALCSQSSKLKVLITHRGTLHKQDQQI